MSATKIKRLTSTARIPHRANPTDAGADVHADEATTIRPGERRLVSIGIAMAVPEGFYARIAPRSGLAVKQGIDVMAGVVDSSYRGEVKVLLVNLGNEPYVINIGDRIAQVIIEKCDTREFDDVDDLDETDRGEGGFGSTGTDAK